MLCLQLMVEAGGRVFAGEGVPKRASCSKETLYNWFGDRDGLADRHGAVAGIQGAHAGAGGGKARSSEAFRKALIAFAANWLSVITADVSAALNRLAISHAGSGKEPSGRDCPAKRAAGDDRAAAADL